MPATLIVVEFKEEVEFLLKDRPEIFKGDVKVLSLLPEASEVLLKNGIAFETSVPYFGRTSHERCLECVDGIIREVNATMCISDANGIHHAYINALTFYMRQYLGYIVWVVELLENVRERFVYDQMVVCRYAGNDQSQFGLPSQERIIGEIAGFFAPHVSIQSPVLNIPRELRVKRWRKWLRSLVCAFYFPLELVSLKRSDRPAVLYYSFKYRFDEIAKAFPSWQHVNIAPDVKSFTRWTDYSLGFPVRNIHLGELGISPDSEFKKSYLGSIGKFKDVCVKKQLCVYRGHDFSSIILRKIELGYGPQLTRLNKQVASLKKFFNRFRPSVVLSHVARDFSYALGELAETMNIPSVLISHGSHVPPQNRFDRMEWFDHGKGLVHTDYRYHPLQSPWALEHVRAMGYRGNYYAIDPIIFPKVDRTQKETLRLKMYPQAQGKKVVVHAGTPKQRGSNRFYIYETLDEYVAYISDLIEEARKVPEIFLIIRFRPYSYLSTAQLKALLPKGDHYVIATEGSFADYLKIMDLLVSFSSTTIEEALINRIPVVQYDPSGRYVHIVGPVWKDKGFAHVDSVYYIGERRGLGAGLQWILDNHLNATTVGDLFERHVFKDGEAMTIAKFVERLVKNELPKPIDLKAKPHMDGVEMF